MEERTTAASRQLITFVMDNSASCSKDQLKALMAGFRALASQTAQQETLEWELICFDTFTPALVKTFESNEIAPVRACRMPLLGRATMGAAKRLIKRADYLRAKGVSVHRPWMFILSDGFTFDDIEETVTYLDKQEHEGKLLYLPFKLRAKLYTERMQTLDRVKHMIEIKQGHIESFFAFVNGMLEQRRTLPEDVGIKFRKSDFEGWAEL